MNPAKEKTKLSFKKAQGHIAKVIKMIDGDEYCIDIMQQNLAVIGLLKSAHQALLTQHLNHCFTEAITTNNKSKKQKMTEEILQVTKLANK